MSNNEELILVMKNWRVLVPKDFAIGFEGENDTRSLIIEVDDAADYDFKLDVEARDGRESKRNIIDLNKDGNVLSVLLKKEMLVNSGVHRMQVRGIRGEEIRKSNIFHVHVFQSINAEDTFPDPLPSEFSQIEQAITKMKNDTIEASQHPPIPLKDRFWWIWDAEKDEYVISEYQLPAAATFYPDVSEDGIISWSNDYNLENPEPVDITGPQGPKGNVMFAAFDIDMETGMLRMHTDGEYDGPLFELRDDGYLEVIIDA